MILENYDEELRPIINKLNESYKYCITPHEIQNRDPRIVVKYGIFNKNEKKIIEEAIHIFLEENNLVFQNLIDYVNIVNTTEYKSRKDNKIYKSFPFKKFCGVISSKLDKRINYQVYFYILNEYDINPHINTKKDKIELLSYLEKYGKNIKLINSFAKKNFHVLSNFYIRVRQQENIDFDKFMKQIEFFKNENKNIKRADIAKSLKTTIFSIDQHFSRFMRININKEWETENNAFLLLFVLKYNYFKPFIIKIEDIYEIFNNKEIIKELTKEISEKTIEKENLAQTSEIENDNKISEIINDYLEKNIFFKIKEESKRKIDFEDILFTNIVFDWNKMYFKHHVHRNLLKQKLVDLFKKHSIVNFNDCFQAFKKESFEIFEEKVFKQLISNLK